MNIFPALGILSIVVIIGILSRKLKILNAEHLHGLSNYIYHFALPALFLVKIAELNLLEIDINILLGSLLPILTLLFILLILQSLKIISKDWFILLSLSIVFGSNAFFGIAFFDTLGQKTLLDFMVISASFMGPIGIILSLLLFEYANKKSQHASILFKIIKNPLIISIFLGIILSLTQIKIDILFKALSMIAQTAGPLAVFGLGMFIYQNFSFKTLQKSIIPTLFRLILLPLSSYVIAIFLLKTKGELKSFLILQSGIPAAISLFIFAERYKYKVQEISGMIILTSIGSFVVLTILSQLF